MSLIITLIAGRLGLTRSMAGVAAWAAIVLVVTGVGLGVYKFIKHQGADEVRAAIEKDNQDAIKKGIDARMSFDDCLSAGGVYDFRRQRCSGAALGPR